MRASFEFLRSKKTNVNGQDMVNWQDALKGLKMSEKEAQGKHTQVTPGRPAIHAKKVSNTSRPSKKKMSGKKGC